jgi:hypothetical protein
VDIIGEGSVSTLSSMCHFNVWAFCTATCIMSLQCVSLLHCDLYHATSMCEPSALLHVSCHFNVWAFCTATWIKVLKSREGPKP